MLFPAARVAVPEETVPMVPVVAPPAAVESARLNRFCVWTVWVASITTRWLADDLTVIMFEPVNSTCPEVYVVFEAAMLAIPAAPAPPTMEMVSETPFVLPERVMFAPPARTTRPATVPVSPAVLPPLMPAENCVPVCAATERSMRWPVFEETVMPPPTPVKDTVPEVYVAFEPTIPEMPVC